MCFVAKNKFNHHHALSNENREMRICLTISNIQTWRILYIQSIPDLMLSALRSNKEMEDLEKKSKGFVLESLSVPHRSLFFSTLSHRSLFRLYALPS